jgi:hypothetical protein
LEKEGGVDMDLTENKRAVDAFTYGAGTSGYPPQELLAALLTLDGASLTSGEVEELRRTCLAQGGMQESPGGTSPAGAR